MNLFFLGKGGVGKSTSAALVSIFLAQQGFRVLVASLDPAHNQSDILERRLSDAPVKVAPNLEAIEVDQEAWMRVYLRDVHHQVQRTYAYLTALNLETYFGVIRHSPGLEEYALILAFEHLQKTYASRDCLVFDMPPTALSLKFFALPSISLVWLEHLLALRREIIEKRELITKIKLPGKVLERDKVLHKIEEQRGQYQKLKETFEDVGRTRLHLVLNPDRLSHAESLRIHEAMEKIDLSLDGTIYNKAPMDGTSPEIPPAFARLPMLVLPESSNPLIGIAALEGFVRANREEMAEQLSLC